MGCEGGKLFKLCTKATRRGGCRSLGDGGRPLSALSEAMALQAVYAARLCLVVLLAPSLAFLQEESRWNEGSQMLVKRATGDGDATEIVTFNVWETVDTASPMPQPRALSAHAKVSLQCTALLIVHGGITPEAQTSLSFTYLSDTWVFFLDTQVWQQLPFNRTPPASGGATMSILGNRIVLALGVNASLALNDVWVLDLSSLLQRCNPGSINADMERDWERANTTCTGPDCVGTSISPRWSHSAADIAGSIFVYGGIATPWANGLTTSFSLVDETVWRLSQATLNATVSDSFVWSSVPAASGPGRRGGATYATVQGALFIAGG
jgi:hypothetical protein